MRKRRRGGSFERSVRNRGWEGRRTRTLKGGEGEEFRRVGE